MKYNCFKRVICFTLTIAIVFSISAFFATANNIEVIFTVKCDAEDTNYTLNLIKVEDKWYIKANDLALLAKADAKQENNGISFYKKSPYVFLWNVNANNCKKHNSSYYVPLQSTSSNIGVRFYLHGNTPKVEVLKTPQQLYAEINAVFKDESLQIINITSTVYYAIEESAARIWSALPFVGSGSIIGSLTGKDEYDRYLDIMTMMLNGSGSISEFLSSTADFDGHITKYADILSKVAQLTKKGGALYNYLKSKGVSDEVINALAYEYNPYEHDLGDFLKGYATVAKIVDIGYILDLCSYYAAIVDMDEATALCMKRVFGDSDNKYAKKATESAMDLKFGDGYTAISDIYGGIVGNIILNTIDEALDKKLAAGEDDIIGVGTTIFDSVFQLSDKATATIYMSICAYLQHDILKCIPDYQSFSTYDMRAITLMYLRLALVACDCLDFDKDLEGVVKTQKVKINAYIDGIFDYAETEYDPNYNNSQIIDYLNDEYKNISTPDDNVFDNSSLPDIDSSFEDDESSNDDSTEPSLDIVGSGKCGDDATWQLDEIGTLTISGSGKMYDYKDTTFYQGTLYTNAPWFGLRSNIKSVIIQSDITTIGDYAFFNCRNINKVTMHDSITSIGEWAFRCCTNLNSVIISDGMPSNGEEVLSGNIEAFAFDGCASLIEITIPDSITTIGDNAFSDCTSLTKITIPNNVTSIGDGAFYNCALLKSVTIPDSVTEIKGGAFCSCTSLTSIIIPNGVTSLSYGLFFDCTSLTKITVPDSVMEISRYTFQGCTSLASISIPYGVENIPLDAFWNCTSLKSINIPSSVISIEASAFCNCPNLTDVYYGGSEADWNKITINSYYNDNLINATIHYDS